MLSNREHFVRMTRWPWGEGHAATGRYQSYIEKESSSLSLESIEKANSAEITSNKEAALSLKRGGRERGVCCIDIRLESSRYIASALRIPLLSLEALSFYFEKTANWRISAPPLVKQSLSTLAWDPDGCHGNGVGM